MRGSTVAVGLKGAEKRRAETLGKITEAARDLFSKKGYHNTQVMDIVNEVGMSAGTFYNYFKDKRDLFLHITKENIEDLRLRLISLRQPDNTTDFRKRIARLHDTYTAFFDYVDDHPTQLLMILRNGFGVDEDLDGVTWDIYRSFAEDIAEDFEKWQRQGYIQAVNLKILGHIVLGMSLQVAHSYVVEKEFSREEAIIVMNKATRAILRAYLTDKGRATLNADLSDNAT
jgi:AcrR family transcriptional regulator